MSDISDYLEGALLDHVYRNVPLASPAAVYLALYTSDPGDDNSGTEVSGAGYARQIVTFDRTLNTISNNVALTYTASGGDFGTITHIGVLDALAAGNLLHKSALDTPKTIEDGDQLTFAIGDVDFTLD
ncbi:MAG: hypothetical protein HRT64_12390 [Erythrobacter sp.]|nr:hypothetical protein [Erythrobacter sp.]